MARSPKEDPIYNDMQHGAWNYCEATENCAPGAINERKQPPISSNSGVLADSSMYGNVNYGDVYNMNKQYNVQASDSAAAKDDKLPYSNMTGGQRGNCQNYGNAMLNLGNGQLVRVFYDENKQQLIFPMTGQYELFNSNQGLRDLPLPVSQPSHMFTLNQEYANNNHKPPVTTQNTNFTNDNSQSVPTSNFLKEVLGNWEPNSSGTYSPFGQNYPLNHPDAPTLITHQTPVLEPLQQTVKTDNSPKRNESSPLADNTNKKRIVAEVKPMRPSYSDVLAKNTKNNMQPEPTRRTKPQNFETKPNNKTVKPEKLASTMKVDEHKLKSEKKHHTNTISSGSESGDVNADDSDKRQKPNKKSKNKRSNISRKWSSLDDITNEEDASFDDDHSQFVFIENHIEKPVKKVKKCDQKSKHSDKHTVEDNDYNLEEEEDDKSQFVFQENQGEAKSRKKKDTRSYHKSVKPLQDKKKGSQSKGRRNKRGYLGLAQSYLERWGSASWKAVMWFMYLLSDICGMTAHLSFDLCTSVFTQTYVSSQAVWRSSKDWLAKIGNNKYLQYIDRKFGHTWLGFWRKLKWFKKESDSDNSEAAKLNENIPLPATGEEAMKRLLACKGKDPYSILGVSVTCTDEEIKRYYRRQAFLVHPDKNQQPGAEEAFKILQHAFDLIGEPERRSMYDRRTVESRHAEAAWSELSQLLAQLHDKMEFHASTIRCTNCGRRHKRVLTERPCFAARYCAQCRIRHSAKEGDIWAESSMMGLLVMYYACMDGAVYQITQWASCQKKNLKQLRPDCHVVQYRIVLGNKASADLQQRTSTGHDPNLEEFLNNLYSKSGVSPNSTNTKQPGSEAEAKKKRNKKPKA